ncbi:DUF4294 domain-containing protein [Polluticoccus soli]|uniref:DUF4294 domain-containing protein n=1 Tax=Polluticoccus soli TaxID=3034150 RepID=UPI0023E241D9|nr:DUF4294 domain-containing protein [Flavipsychrobacter sp. JY13-12]
MTCKYFKSLLFVLAMLLAGRSFAQPSGNDSILLGGIVVGTDTFAMAFLPDVTITDKLPKKLARQRVRMDRLKYNVTKVYPYAIVAADVLKDVDVTLAKYDNDKAKRKEYLKSLERELNSRFKGELENLTITQGQILVKLINRQTGKNCFSIIRELKGGFSAVVWQSVALLFSNNLKREYDPVDRDREIEYVVAELEANNYYNWRYQRQQAMRMQSGRY